jgi:hypothetical protein
MALTRKTQLGAGGMDTGESVEVGSLQEVLLEHSESRSRRNFIRPGTFGQSL